MHPSFGSTRGWPHCSGVSDAGEEGVCSSCETCEKLGDVLTLWHAASLEAIGTLPALRAGSKERAAPQEAAGRCLAHLAIPSIVCPVPDDKMLSCSGTNHCAGEAGRLACHSS